VNCTIKGDGSLAWDTGFKPTPDKEWTAFTGWKYYNLKNSSGGAYTVTSDWDYELNATEYNAGFASKALVLGQPTSNSDQTAWVSTNAWSPVEP
jgi:hypothetical protein